MYLRNKCLHESNPQPIIPEPNDDDERTESSSETGSFMRVPSEEHLSEEEPVEEMMRDALESIEREMPAGEAAGLQDIPLPGATGDDPIPESDGLNADIIYNQLTYGSRSSESYRRWRGYITQSSNLNKNWVFSEDPQLGIDFYRVTKKNGRFLVFSC